MCGDPAGALLNYWMYSELFHRRGDALLAGVTDAKELPAPLDAETRRRFVADCVPDTRTSTAVTTRRCWRGSCLMRRRCGRGRWRGLLGLWTRGSREYEVEEAHELAVDDASVSGKRFHVFVDAGQHRMRYNILGRCH